MQLLQTAILLASSAHALSSAQWRSQSIYQVVTDRFARTDGSTKALCDMGNYCGGTFQGLINKLDYIQGMGFTAIWISPVTAQISTMTPYGLPYHGYWPQDFYSINPKFGTAADLKALSAALHSKGMYLMVDVVPNHSAYNGAPEKVEYSLMNPFNKASYYHTPYCAIDYNNQTSIESCWMGDTKVALPDLKVETTAVQTLFNSWVQEFVANYTIDGLRIDSAMQMSKKFFPGFVSAAGVYAVGEVVNGGPTYLCDYQNYMPGVLNYAYYFWIKRAFSDTTATMTELANNVPWLRSTCKDTTILGNFMENHDQPRFASFTNDTSLIQNAVAFTILSDGIPIIYYGQEQGFSGKTDPYNREPLWPSGYDKTTDLYKFIGKINAVRNRAISLDGTYASKTGKTIYSDSKTMVTLKGGLISVFMNDGADAASRTITISQTKSGLTGKSELTDVISCTSFVTDATGNLAITVDGGLPMALYDTNGLAGSGLCGIKATPTSTKTSSTSTSTSASVTVKPVATSSPTSTSTTSTTSSSKVTSTSTSSTISSTPVAITSPTSTTSKTSSSMTSTSTTPVAIASTSTSSIKSTSTTPAPTSSTESSTSTSSTTSIKSTSSTSSSPTSIPTTSPSTSSTASIKSTSSTSTSTSSVASSAVSETPVATLAANTLTCPKSNTTTVTSYGRAFVVECDIDHSAGDLAMVYVTGGLVGCVNACAASEACVAASLSGTACYMKNKVGKKVYNNVQGLRLLSPSELATSTAAPTPSCTPLATSNVTFNSNIDTAWGTSAYIVGSVPALGSWNTSQAVSMSAANYPIWSANVTFDAGAYVEYKYIQITGTGGVSWESGINRNFTAPTISSCTPRNPAAIASGEWRD